MGRLVTRPPLSRYSIRMNVSKTYASCQQALVSAIVIEPMRLFPLPSVFGLAASARERRTIVTGLVVIVTALAAVYGIRPLAGHWLTRERTIAAQQQRLARLRGLVSSEAKLREIVTERSAVLASGPQRLL